MSKAQTDPKNTENPTGERGSSPEKETESKTEDRPKNVDSEYFQDLLNKEKQKREEERKIRKRAEQKIEKQKKEIKDLERRNQENEGSDLGEDNIDQLADQIYERNRKRSQLDNLIAAQTDDASEQSRIRQALGELKSTGDMAKDVKRAALLANEQNINTISANEEARSKSEKSTSNDRAVSSDKPLYQKGDTQEEKKVKEMEEKFSSSLPPRYSGLNK